MTTLQTPSRSTEASATRWLPLAVLLSGTFLVVLDFFIVNVALPSIQGDLGAGDSALEWLVAGYGLTFGGLLMAVGPVSQRWGRRRTYVAGVLVFVLASALCGVAPDVLTLNAARLLQGVGAAMLAPMVLALIGDLYAGPERVRAMSAYATVMGLAAALGQLIGGVLIRVDVAGLGWRTVFLVNIPVGLAIVAAAPRLLPAAGSRQRAPLDVLSLVLVVTTSAAVLLPLLEGRRLGWPLWTWESLALGALLGTWLARRTRRLAARGGHPLVDPAAFRSPAVRGGLVAQALLFCGMASYFLVLGLYLQVGHGLGPLGSGLIFTVMAVTYMVGTRHAAGLVARFGARVLPVGALVFAAGHLLTFAAVEQIGVTGSVLWLAPGLAVSGLGMGVCLSSLVASVMAGVEPVHAAGVSGSLSTVQQLGNALGVALIGLVFFGATDRGVDVAFTQSLLWLAGATLVLAAVTARLGRWVA
ncbi:Major Facilitator Superfamily protein [Nocardioides terrae]|uniref:Major Facilitator Superfamily protein n=1 Tax=Nocardioides terrae TaxID=574651 RepID=A0A1I1NMG0_9ACTN|nr:MFS transporter [Nocardioides terrae]SFC98472.1 Major Facilitator Superfamily protein [Nocardioides terrae]